MCKQKLEINALKTQNEENIELKHKLKILFAETYSNTSASTA